MSTSRQQTKLLDRLIWIYLRHKDEDPANVVRALIQEIEAKHRIVDPELITEEMLDACFSALLEHYDPPDMKKRKWHALKAERRYTSMVKAAPKIVV